MKQREVNRNAAGWNECLDDSIVCYCVASLSLRHHAHGPLAKCLMHMAHKSGNTLGVSKLSMDWLNFTGFPGDVCVAFFNIQPGNKDAMAPNPLMKKESQCLQLWQRALISIN